MSSTISWWPTHGISLFWRLKKPTEVFKPLIVHRGSSIPGIELKDELYEIWTWNLPQTLDHPVVANKRFLAKSQYSYNLYHCSIILSDDLFIYMN